MCGITGWANLDPSTPPHDGAEELLRSMCDRMTHRGPDSEGYLVDDGTRRLLRRVFENFHVEHIELRAGPQDRGRRLR